MKGGSRLAPPFLISAPVVTESHFSLGNRFRNHGLLYQTAKDKPTTTGVSPVKSSRQIKLTRRLVNIGHARQHTTGGANRLPPFFFLDEFGTLQRLSSIIQLLTLSRSKGGSCWIGIQDIGQLDKIYTEQLRQAIVNACGGNLIFSVSDPVTARFLAEKIGETEYAETEETQSLGASKKKEGISLVRHKKTEKLVLPSDIECLRDLECYLKLPNYDFTVIKLEYRSFDNLHPSFIIRPELNM